ncbi:hypothetical protein ACFVFF_36950 [Streptomyces sp. NPDC057680]|uniref:hypothetical protein n=1 Tax=Streptomyces sp. NPDC057680 TaxID=3346208 RepID=UPI0036C3857C
MQPQNLRGISVNWTRPAYTDLVVSGVLGYLLYQQPSVPEWVTVLAMIAALRCIHVTWTV